MAHWFDNSMFPQFTSTTPWEKMTLKTPTNATEFKAMKFCSCIQQGMPFEWKDCKNWPLKKDVLGTNNLDLEYAMWLLYDLNNMLKRIESRWYEKTKNGGMVARDFSNATFALEALKILLKMNDLQFLPTENLDKVVLTVNLFKEWSAIPAGEYKLPWQLLPTCNRIIENWLRSEIIFSIQTIKCLKQTCNDFVLFQIYGIRLLQAANVSVAGLTTPFTDFLKHCLILQNAVLCYWLPNIYTDNYSDKFFDPTKKYSLHHQILSLCDTLPEEFKKINTHAHVLAKIIDAATASLKICPISTSSVKEGATLLKQSIAKIPAIKFSENIANSFLVTDEKNIPVANYLAMLDV